MAARNQVSTSKGTNKPKVPADLPPPPPLPVVTVGQLPGLNLKKKRKVPEVLDVEEGEMVPPKGAKQPKRLRDKRASSVERGHAGHVAEALEQPLLLPRDMDAYRRFKQPNLFLSQKRDLAIVFVAEEWVKDARNQARAEAHSRSETEKILGALKEEQAVLSEKLKGAVQAKDSAKAGLKTTKRQAEDQCQKLHLTEIDLATERQMIKDLGAELQRIREAVQLSKEAIESEKQASYQLGVPTNSALRKLGSIYYHPKIRELPCSDSSSPRHALEVSEKPLTNQTTLTLPKASKGPGQTDDQGKGAEGVQNKDQIQEKRKVLSEAEDKEVASKAKATEAKGNKANPKAKDVAISQSSKAVDPPAPKTKI
nr:uncharacterized protein LOC112015056 [Quercus suber]